MLLFEFNTIITCPFKKLEFQKGPRIWGSECIKNIDFGILCIPPLSQSDSILQNLKSNLTMWKLGTLPPALIAFKGHVRAIDPHWHMLGLGYQNNTKIENVQKAAVIHYNGQSKPWLQIGFEHLRPFWSKYVNYSNEFISNCHILE